MLLLVVSATSNKGFLVKCIKLRLQPMLAMED